jgi:hypothetical protein
MQVLRNYFNTAASLCKLRKRKGYKGPITKQHKMKCTILVDACTYAYLNIQAAHGFFFKINCTHVINQLFLTSHILQKLVLDGYVAQTHSILD